MKVGDGIFKRLVTQLWGRMILRVFLVVKKKYGIILILRLATIPALGSDYVVKFTTGGPAVGDDAWDISFEANETVQTTDEGQPLKIMATVVAIVKDFIDRPELNRGMRKFVFMGVGKADEEGPERTSRTKMYMRFLRRPGENFAHQNV